MGRGRGKGKKLTVVSHEDAASGGEELIPTYRRRGRPAKRLSNPVDEEETVKIEEGEDAKTNVSSKDVNGVALENGNKRKRNQKAKEKPDSNLDENETSMKSSVEEPAKPNGFRPNGSRRKSKPRRAA